MITGVNGIYESCEYVIEARRDGEYRPLFNRETGVCFGYVDEFTGAADEKCMKCELNYHTRNDLKQNGSD